MSISYQFGDVDAHGAMIRAQAASLEAEHQAIVRDVLAAGDFWGGSGSVACQEFITQLGRNFQVIYEQANSHGQKVQTAGNNMARRTPPSAPAGPNPSPRRGRTHRASRCPVCFLSNREIATTLAPNAVADITSLLTACRAALRSSGVSRRRMRAYSVTATQAPRTVVETKLAALARWLSVGA